MARKNASAIKELNHRGHGLLHRFRQKEINQSLVKLKGISVKCVTAVWLYARSLRRKRGRPHCGMAPNRMKSRWQLPIVWHG